MDNNWKTLRNMLLEQLEDIRHKRGSSGNYSTCSKCYNEVLKVMDAIDNNTQNLLHPFNCVWKTDEEMKEIKNKSYDYIYIFHKDTNIQILGMAKPVNCTQNW